MFDKKHHQYMQFALEQAKIAYEKGEVPVGCVIIKNHEVIAKSHNMTQETSNGLMHAEIIAINEACYNMKNKFLDDCDLYVTLEPCDFCINAILISRIKRVFFATKETKIRSKKSNLELYGHILEEEANKLLTSFFQNLRFLGK